jgi:ankyrin repeat protein
MARDAAGSSLGDSPLHDSVIEGNASQTRILLEAGANPNCTVLGGVTPIHCAAFQRNIEHVSILQEYGANLSAVTDKGQSILLFAVKRRMIGVSDMLSSHSHTKQNIEPKASELHTDDATLAVINALYDSPAGWPRLLQSLNQPDKDGVTPLMLAAEAGFIKTVTMLLQRGARPDLRDHVGYTALKYAASGGHRDLVRLLLEADVRVQEHDLSHLLKLGSKNLTTTAAACPSPSTTTTSPVYHVHGNGKDGGGWWERRRKCDGEMEEERDDDSSATIAEEMVKLLREMGVGVLEGLIRLAEQKRKLGVLEALLAAV